MFGNWKHVFCMWVCACGPLERLVLFSRHHDYFMYANTSRIFFFWLGTLFIVRLVQALSEFYLIGNSMSYCHCQKVGPGPSLHRSLALSKNCKVILFHFHHSRRCSFPYTHIILALLSLMQVQWGGWKNPFCSLPLLWMNFIFLTDTEKEEQVNISEQHQSWKYRL